MFKGYKTVIFNLVMALAAIVTLLTGIDTAEGATQMKEGVLSILVGLDVVWAVGAAWIRAYTDTPIFDDEVKYHYKKGK